MKNFYYLFLILLSCSLSVQAQSGKQKKADRLYKDFAYLEATDVYKELIENEYNITYNSTKLGDSYMMLRSPENAVHYYGDVIEDTTISPEYYYKYAQALRGVKRYDESKQWLRKYLESGKGSDQIQTMLNKDEYKSRATYKVQPSEFNSEVSDFGVFVKDEQVYFVSARAKDEAVKEKTYSWNGEPFLDIYVMDKSSGNVSPIGGDVNTKLHDGPAVISPDGSTIYFTRNNYLDNKEGKRDKEKTNHLKLYSAKSAGNGWADVKELSFNSSDYSVGHPSLSPDGKTLYFTSDMPNGNGGTDIYKVSVDENGNFGTPENLGEPVNTEFDETFPFMDTDGTLYFSSNGHAGLGLFDIFRFEDGEVENLGEPVNSSMDDFAYFQVSDSREGFISTNRGGGSDDIYVFNKLNPLIVKGQVTDAVNGKPISAATVRVMNKENEQIAFLETDEEGNYQTEVARDKIFPLEAKEIKYKTFNGELSTMNTDEKDEMIYDIQLNPIEDVEYLAEIDNIYFDFDKSAIRPDAAKELDKLVDLMQNQYPELVIEIGSHTDRRGTNAYNEKLAERRAKATYDYLLSKDISEDRISTYKGYGETKPAIDCERCSEKDHQLNRRSMFSVVKMD
ncbi:OmpA family protein [Gramella sp. MAR_2010_147]|uniref:OmpA family protein n=1 Tax=Gramella sp. MAR_2010_147 TaxID=1250205 RepID=UPI00087AE624|nr:OmpA family protein [Gramella sp. MAR_2010_147]SDR73658.1 WD40-like Beta Propeller Repeat [Gramella sp. MAR_2010_147]SDR73742.1 WD40-like Beta Propeller Repeat [Gramella sp. MAR_2010_147]